MIDFLPQMSQSVKKMAFNGLNDSCFDASGEITVAMPSSSVVG
jgi:hypothetical protein